MRISTKSQYGLRALIYLAKLKKVSSIKEISKNEKIPFHYLEKILVKLEKGKIVKAKKGPKGGYFLSRSPATINLKEIFKTLDGDFVAIKCLGEKKQICPNQNKCLAKIFWFNFKKSTDKMLKKITLKSLIKQNNNYESLL